MPQMEHSHSMPNGTFTLISFQLFILNINTQSNLVKHVSKLMHKYVYVLKIQQFLYMAKGSIRKNGLFWFTEKYSNMNKS